MLLFFLFYFLQCTDELMYLLGAFSFCTGTMEPLHNSAAVQSMLDTITDALIHYISQSGYLAQEQARRQAQLLLLLSHIRHMR